MGEKSGERPTAALCCKPLNPECCHPALSSHSSKPCHALSQHVLVEGISEQQVLTWLCCAVLVLSNTDTLCLLQVHHLVMWTAVWQPETEIPSHTSDLAFFSLLNTDHTRYRLKHSICFFGGFPYSTFQAAGDLYSFVLGAETETGLRYVIHHTDHFLGFLFLSKLFYHHVLMQLKAGAIFYMETQLTMCRL